MTDRSYPDGWIDTPTETETLRDLGWLDEPPTLDALDEIVQRAVGLEEEPW